MFGMEEKALCLLLREGKAARVCQGIGRGSGESKGKNAAIKPLDQLGINNIFGLQIAKYESE